jgi:hypothetical protein
MHAPSEERKTNKPNKKLYRNVYNHEQRNEIVQSMGEEVDVCHCLIYRRLIKKHPHLHIHTLPPTILPATVYL